MRGFTAEHNTGVTSRRDYAGTFGGQKEQQNGGETKTTNIRHRAHGKPEANLQRDLALPTNCIPAGTMTPAAEAQVKEEDSSTWQRYHGANVHSH